MITTILSFVFVLGVLVFVHELGHFAVAKWVGILVEKFSLGFPPNIFTRKKGDTTYCIGLIPLGGFVKMAGDASDEKPTGASNEFGSKTVGRRAAVIFAGPFMNYLAAIVFMIALFMVEGVPKQDPEGIVVGTLLEDGPGARAGLQTDDLIISVDGQRVHDFREMATLINAKVAEDLTFSWLHGADTISATVITAVNTHTNASGGLDSIGIIGFSQQRESVGLFKAASLGFTYTHFVVAMTATFVKDLIIGNQSAKMIGGPIFIAKEAGRAARQGPAGILYLLGVLSINLAILNVLPIPILDGAHLVFLAVEKIKGSPVSLKVRGWSQQVGLVLIMSLIIFVTYNDIMRIFTSN